MTVLEAVTKSGLTPRADYTGIETADDFVFAIQTDADTQTDETKWIVAAERVKEHSGSLNASTSSDTFIRTGPIDTKGPTQRTFALNGNRCPGDAFQNFILSHKIMYGSGSDVIVPYIYFSLRTGKGEKGMCTLILTSDAGGAAGSPATFACDVKGIGTPEAFDYTTAASEENTALDAARLGQVVLG